MSMVKDETSTERPLMSTTSPATAVEPEDEGRRTVRMTDTNNMAIPKNSGFRTIEIVGRLVFAIIMKFWGLCTTAVLILLLMFWLYGGLVAFSLLCVAVIGFMYNVQDQLLYYPDQPPHARFYVEQPGLFGLPFDNVFIKTQDGVHINMFFIKQPPHLMGKAHTVIYFHGNAGNIGHRLMNAHAMYSCSGSNILLVEYRGYGRSAGSPNENGIYLDAQAAFDYLLQRPDIDREKIIIFGRSLGGAVAIHLASQPYYAKKALCLIIENTFTNLPEIAMYIFNSPFLQYLPNLCFKNKYPSRSRLRKIRLPTLFLSGLGDTLIPPRMMSNLYETSGSLLKRLGRFDAGTHNETWQCHGYYETINRFLVEVSKVHQMDPPSSAATYSVNIPFDDTGRGVYTV